MRRLINVSDEQKPNPNEVRCADGCGNTSMAPQNEGWARMEITQRYRCPKCNRQLMEVNRGKED